MFSCWAKLPKAQTAATDFVLVAVLKKGNSAQDQLQWFGNTASVSSNQQWGRYQVEVNLDDATVKNLIPANEDAVIQCYLWLTGNNPVLVDEIRFCASHARMTTDTYKSLVGKTSSTDENQVTTYFEYDADNNPTLVRDDKGNILKRTKHNIAAETQDLTLAVERGTSNLYPGQLITFTASVPECLSGVRYYWNFGEPSSTTNTVKDVTAPTHAYAATGTYTVTVTAEAPGMNPVERTLSLTLSTPLNAYIDVNGSTVYDNCNPSGGSTILTLSASGGCGGYTYRWERQAYDASGNMTQDWTPTGTDNTPYSQRLSGIAPRLLIRCVVTDNCGNRMETGAVEFVRANSRCAPTP